MISSRVFWYLLVASVACVVVLLGQEQVPRRDVKGYVRDARSGEGLPFANVVVQGTKRGTTTDTYGYFVLADVQGDSCTVVASYIGYLRQAVHVDLQRSVPLLMITLEPTSIELPGTTVTAAPTLIEVSHNISQIALSPRFIFSLPSIGQVDIFRTLQLLPGINAGSSGSSELYVRGGEPDQNLILFDGMTIYHVDHFFGFFSAFNADALKDIQVFKGGFPAEYGGRISSVVDLTGKTGDENKTHIGVGVNLLSANAVVEGPLRLFEKSTFLVAARRSYTDFIQSDLYDNIYKFVTGDESGGMAGPGVRRQQMGPMSGNMMAGDILPAFYFFDLNAKLTMSLTPRDIVSLSMYNGKDDLDKSQDFGSTSFMIRQLEGQANLQVEDYSRWGNLGFSGKWSRRWDDRLGTDFLVASSEFYSNYDRSTNANALFTPASDSLGIRRGFSTATKEDNTVRDLTIRADVNWQVSGAHRVDAGVWLSRFDAGYVSSLNDSTELLNRKSDTWLRSVYAQDKWNWGDLELTLGLRTSHYQETDKVYWEPRASAIYSLSDAISLKAAWGYYHQFVNRITNENVLEGSREFWLTADKNLLPSFAEHQIVGASYEGRDFVLSVEAYNKNLENLVEFSRRYRMSANFANFFLFGSGNAKGVELLLQKKTGNLTGWVGYTLAKVEYQFPSMNNGEPFPAEHDHRNDVKAVAKYSFGDWTFAANWVFATGNAYTAPESQYFIRLLNDQSLSYIHVSGKNANRLPDFHQLDVSVSRHFDWERVKAEIGISAFNVYNRRNVSYRQYNLTSVPITVTDITLLGFMPTIYAQFHL